MLLRVFAIFVSIAAHGVVARALWLHFRDQPIEMLEAGEGQDIVIEPRGLILNEAVSAGDSLASVTAQNAIATDNRLAPPPPSSAPLEDFRETENDVVAKPAWAGAVVEQQVAPPPRVHGLVPPEDIPDVIASNESAAVDEIGGPRVMQPPDPVVEKQAITGDEAAPREQTAQSPAELQPQAPNPDRVADQHVAVVDSMVPPLEVDRPKSAIKAQAPTLGQSDKKTAATVDAPPPPEEIKEPEVPRADETTFVPDIAEREPEIGQVVAQPQQVVLATELNSGLEQHGGEASIVGAYLGKVNDRVQNAKVHPRSRSTGTVVVRYTIGTDGALLSREIEASSGVQALDEAALASLQRAVPFPPIPPEVSAKPMSFTQPFKFVIR